MLFFDLVHAAVCFREELFSRGAVRGIKGTPNADGDYHFRACGAASLLRGPRQSFFHFGDVVSRHLGKNKNEFVSTKTPDLVVFAAGRLESGSDFPKQLISGEMSKGVIDLLEAIEVTALFQDADKSIWRWASQ